MMKYILILILAAGMLMSQEINANGSLDQPIKVSATPALSIRVVGSYFNSWNVKRIVDFLSTLSQISSSSEEYDTTHCLAGRGWDFDGPFTIFSSFWSANQDLSGIKNELSAYSTAFPQSSEVFSATASNGYTTYYDWYGKQMATGSANNTTLDGLMGAGNVSSNLNFYAGRNTGALPETTTYTERDELQITVSNGTKYTIYAYDTTTPIVLDMDADGCLQASSGKWLPHAVTQDVALVEFDMNGDGFDEMIEWVGANDGLLIAYNPNEKVTGRNLFGDANGFSNGFEQLAARDTNGDSKLTQEELKDLSVWQDKNGNASVDFGEITAVSDLGITEINTTHVGMVSSFVRNGETCTMWDWHPTTALVKKANK